MDAVAVEKPAPQKAGAGPPAPVWLALAVTAATLVVAFLLKDQCTHVAWGPPDYHQYKRMCYNDIQPLFYDRGVIRGLLPYRDIQVEYPVVTGSFMYWVGALMRTFSRHGGDAPYFRLSALLLAPFAFLTTLALRPHVTRQRLLIWAATPPLVLYAFHNWDLIAVAGATAGMASVERLKTGASGAWLAFGASAKLYPAFLMPGAGIELWKRRGMGTAARLAVWFALGLAAFNVPWMLISWKGWKGIWAFHARRYPDYGTVWYWIGRAGHKIHPSSWWDPGQAGFRDLVSKLSFAGFAAGSAWFLWRMWRRDPGQPGGSSAAAGLGILAAFLIFSKVNSPQYTLWMVPLIAMLDVPWPVVAAYLATDLAVYVSGFMWFTVLSAPAPAWEGIFEASVLARAAALILIAWAAARALRVRPDFFPAS